MDCYNDFADYYNELMDCDYDKWSQFLVKHGCAGDGADLACGTGNITFRLAAAGCRVIGADVSPRMLAVAESKKRNVTNPMFRLQDMTEFSVTKSLDFVTCVCDGINYLKGSDNVAKTFERVYASLKEGGRFIFDVSSSYKLRQVLGNNFFYEDGDDVTYLWTNKAAKDKVVMDIVFFAKAADGSYRRFDERHVQYIYEKDLLADLLKKAGFRDIETFDDYNEKPAGGKSRRIVFRAVK